MIIDNIALNTNAAMGQQQSIHAPSAAVTPNCNYKLLIHRQTTTPLDRGRVGAIVYCSAADRPLFPVSTQLVMSDCNELRLMSILTLRLNGKIIIEFFSYIKLIILSQLHISKIRSYALKTNC